MAKKSNQSGQALIEYILVMAIIVSVAGGLIASVKATRDKIWKRMICEISASCATCAATDSAKAVLSAKADCR